MNGRSDDTIYARRLMPCICQGWRVGMPQVEAAQVLHTYHGNPYTGGPFLYCPWCGERRLADGED